MKPFAEMDENEREEVARSLPGILEDFVPADCKYVLVLSADAVRGSCVSNIVDHAAVVRLLRNVSAGS